MGIAALSGQRHLCRRVFVMGWFVLETNIRGNCKSLDGLPLRFSNTQMGSAQGGHVTAYQRTGEESKTLSKFRLTSSGSIFVQILFPSPPPPSPDYHCAWMLAAVGSAVSWGHGRRQWAYVHIEFRRLPNMSFCGRGMPPPPLVMQTHLSQSSAATFSSQQVSNECRQILSSIVVVKFCRQF